LTYKRYPLVDFHPSPFVPFSSNKMQFAHFCINPNFSSALAARKRMRNCYCNLRKRVRSGFWLGLVSWIRGPWFPAREAAQSVALTGDRWNQIPLPVDMGQGIWLSYRALELTECPTNNTRNSRMPDTYLDLREWTLHTGI